MDKFRNKTIITLEFSLVLIFHLIVLSSCMKSKNTDDVKVSEAVPIKIVNETETSVEESISEEQEITETLSYDSSNSLAEDESLMAILYDEPESKKPIETLVSSTDSQDKAYEEDTGKEYISETITFNSAWEFGSNSKINTGAATLYYADGDNKKGKTICVNAGHGTAGGESVKTLCHPDGTAKVTGGSTAAGSITATAVSSGTTMLDGTSEAYVNLKVAKALKTELLSRGYNVLMIRESEDVQLDNIARTVIANENANCHIAIHYDSTESDKGAFFMSVADGIKDMYPVSTIWKEDDRLGTSVISGLSENGVKIFGDGSLQMDLTQTSYSKIPSIDIELGDRASDYGDKKVVVLAKGIADGIDIFFS